MVGLGVPRLLQRGHSAPATAAGVSRPWTTTGERHPRKDKECSPGCGPEPSMPTCPRRPWPGRCQALCCFSTPFPGPSAHLLALSAPAILNGSLCAPQELARKSPDRNAGQRYLLWIQAPLGAVPILWKAGLYCAAGLLPIWERAGARVNGRMFCTLPSGVITRARGMAVPWSLPGALFPTLSLCCFAPRGDSTHINTKRCN